jgi:dipeptidyl aminopeptidase/acylaminoacyl peptidase
MLRPLALALLLSSSLAFGATPTIDQLLSMKSVSRPRISPDGRLVAYEISEADWKENAYVTQLWLADVQSGRAFQLTRGKKSSDNPQWSPDGRWLAFMTERESGSDNKTPRQIWLISPAGGEAWQLTKHGAAIDSFRWSDDGRFVAFTAPVPETQAAKDRKEKYSDFEVFEEDFEQNQLWTVDVTAAEKSSVAADDKQITSDRRISVGEFDWSPDGTTIAFAGGANPLIAFDGTNDLYLVDLAHENTVKKIVSLPGPESDPHFSPDGRELAFNTSLAADDFYYVNARIATVRVADVLQKPATAAADVANLTAAFDEDAALLDWAPAGIYFRGYQKTASHLFRLDPKTKTIARMTAPDELYFVDGSFSGNFDTMAYTAPGRTRVNELYVTPLASAAPKRITDLMAQYAGLALGSAEVVSWKSKDGATIEGVLHKPANYDASKKYPLLVVIHGGPTGVSRPFMNPVHRYYPIELFLAKGALVLEPNYRGSAGYGEQFRTLNVRNLGVGDMWDVMSGIDALVGKGIADPDRLGSMGWSQGGYISAFLTTNTDRFKAISVGAGISNWMTYYVNTDITPFTRQYLKATPWDDPKIYADTSPMTNIRNARTPTLIQHGQNDKRVPAPNAFELYRGLRDVGVPARLIVYAGFGHAINKPKSNRAVLQHNYDWFSHYIFGEPFPKDSPLFGRGAGAP